MDRLRAQRGTTLIEVLIVMLVVAIAMVALYGLVDSSNKITKQQTEVADVQQSARIGVSELSRVIRQSRVGGLYFGNAVLPIANNFAGGTSLGTSPLTDLSGASHFVRKGTDVIEVRGILFGDKYVLDEGGVACSGSCTTTTQIAVTIPATASLGYVNFPAGGTPSLSTKAKDFYFVVQDGENTQVTVNGSTYLVPIYVAGRVSATAPCTLATSTWCTLTTTTLTFKMNPQDAGAKKLDAPVTPLIPSTLAKSIGGGAIDVVRFFVDEGAVDATGSTADTHPSLAQATFDLVSGNYDIQTLVEEAEDLQIAYGVDGADGTAHDGGVSPAAVDESAVNKDEWVGNVANEVEPLISSMNLSTDPKHVDAFLDTSVPPATQPLANPALRSVWISLVVKSTDPDLVYDGPGARGIRILDSAAVSFSAATGRPYRRRPLSLAVSLRNNAFFNK
jgi:prepilin-type N-terminal cleavage/methylation domain-containing protein